MEKTDMEIWENMTGCGECGGDGYRTVVKFDETDHPTEDTIEIPCRACGGSGFKRKEK